MQPLLQWESNNTAHFCFVYVYPYLTAVEEMAETCRREIIAFGFVESVAFEKVLHNLCVCL